MKDRKSMKGSAYRTTGDQIFYLAEADNTEPKKLKVVDEELLTAELLIDDSIKYEAMADRGESGGEYQVDYATHSSSGSLPNADDNTVALHSGLAQNATWWTNFVNGELDTKRSHWVAATDGPFVDSVDLASLYGHGSNVGIASLFVDLDPLGNKQPLEHIEYVNIDWGELDLEWVFLWTCGGLNETVDVLEGMFAGTHLVCGHKEMYWDYPGMGTTLKGLLVDGHHTVEKAWHVMNDEHPPPAGKTMTSRVCGYAGCFNDMIGTARPVRISRDPSDDDEFQCRDHEVEPL